VVGVPVEGPGPVLHGAGWRQENKNAAWYYPHPSPLARKIRNHVAFWNGVEVDVRAVAQAHAAPEARTVPGPEAAPGPE
jgi:hypothetical protein